MTYKPSLTPLATLCMLASLAACGGGGDTQVVTVPAADSTPPLVLITAPMNDATKVALNSALSATFSEAINPATITAATFSVSGVPGTITLSGDNRSATYTPSAVLAPNTRYTATLTTGAQDTSGNGLGSNFSWRFTTGAALDTTAPQVSSVTPLNGSKSNPASSSIAANFNEAINCATATTSNVQLLEGNTTTPIQVGCSGNTLTLLPIKGMPTDTILTASIGPSVSDLASNFLVQPYTWSFGMAPWTRQLGSASEDVAQAITSDAAGNVYAAGFTSGALDGQTSAGNSDLFITKYDARGVKQWTRQLGTAGFDAAYAITSDAAGNVYAAGSTSGALDGQTSAGGGDLFITKYDASGVKQWTRQLGTAGFDYATAITSDAAGNVYAAGLTESALDGQTSAGGFDLFIVKYQADGRKR